MTAAISHATPMVFVVDDDISVRESLELLIHSHGWEPLILSSAQELLTRPPVRVPSCLVLDVPVPLGNGLELQKQLAVERSDMPIICVSTHNDVRTSVRAMKAGALDFLVKPFDSEELLNAIREGLERSRMKAGSW